jgi:hypothetical protein
MVLQPNPQEAIAYDLSMKDLGMNAKIEQSDQDLVLGPMNVSRSNSAIVSGAESALIT